MYGLFKPWIQSYLLVVGGADAANQSDDPLVFSLGPNEVGAVTRILGGECETSGG